MEVSADVSNISLVDLKDNVGHGVLRVLLDLFDQTIQHRRRDIFIRLVVCISTPRRQRVRMDA